MFILRCVYTTSWRIIQRHSTTYIVFSAASAVVNTKLLLMEGGNDIARELDDEIG